MRYSAARARPARLLGRGGRPRALAAGVALALCGLAPASPASANSEFTATGSPPTAGASPPAQPVASAAAPDLVLSNERTFTTWAHPRLTLPIYALAQSRSRRIEHLHLLTEDNFPEVYLLLASHTNERGEVWVKLRIPGRPNGRTGWVARTALGPFHRTPWLIVINLRERHLTALVDGRRRLVAPVGVGKPSTPTPPGHFWIRERFRLSSRSSPYWPYALGTSDYSTLTEWPGGGVVGIHGDFGQPELVPGDPSHGCVRMHAADLAWLAPRLTLGTPVDII